MMEFKIYHQIGHNAKWNFESIEQDLTGDGIILSPRNIEYKHISKIAHSMNNIIFDPQFFLPNSLKGKLETYPFFPKNMSSSGFETSDFTEKYSQSTADECVSFQIENDFEYIVIPARFYEGTPKDLIDESRALFVEPFLCSVQKLERNKEVLLQLIINHQMLKDEDYTSDLLNWITSYNEITGIYLIPQKSLLSKQFKDTDYLKRFLFFIESIKSNNLKVILAYSNIEAIVLSLADPDILTIGSYENTRSFNIKSFEENTKKQYGPRPRLYVSSLLQLIDSDYIGAIEEYFDIFDKNKYHAEMFKPDFNWHFSKPQLYKHLFLEFSNQLTKLKKFDGYNRYLAVKQMIENAIFKYKAIESEGIALDPESDGSHLYSWLSVINLFAKNKWK